MGEDFGAMASQLGYDVLDCPDRFLAFSSSFQNLKIFNRYSVSTTVPASGTNTITINHNLDFYAPYFAIYNDSTNDKAYFGTDSTGNEFTDNVDTIVKQKQNSFTIDVENGFDGKANGTTVYFTIYIFLDDFRLVTEEDITVGAAAGTPADDYGILISKDGYDVTDGITDHLIFTSSSFNAIVHKKGITTGGATISHNLGYVPETLVYQRKTGDDFITLRSSHGTSNSSDLFITATAGTYYYIIFKDLVNV